MLGDGQTGELRFEDCRVPSLVPLSTAKTIRRILAENPSRLLKPT
jgi:hypothetical protein